MHVLSFLVPEDLARSAQVSKNWRAGVDDEQLWRMFNIFRFGKCKKPDPLSWKQFVVANLLHEKTLTDNIHTCYFLKINLLLQIFIFFSPAPPPPPKSYSYRLALPHLSFAIVSSSLLPSFGSLTYDKYDEATVGIRKWA
jgi:hypothetical protein